MSLYYQFETVNSGNWITLGKDVQVKIVGDTLYIQASKSRSDWRYNFMASEDVYKDSDIEFIGHKGFNELWESIRHDIEKLSFRKVTAYSQGAAIGVRVHENYVHRFGFEPDVTITFGCPPSIKNPSAKLKARFTHLVNYHNPRDLVYYAPMLIGYEHVGASRTLAGNVKRPDDVSLLSWLSGHSPAEYRQRLENA